MNKIVIRNAKKEDAAMIARVHIESWRATYKGIMPDDFLNNLNLTSRIEYWNRTLEKATDNVFVAEANNEVIGFAFAGPPTESNNYSSELYAIYMLEAYQGMGIGKKLMSQIAIYLLNCGHQSMYLWVASENTSKAFYKKIGGQKFDKKVVNVGGANVEEDGMAWTNIADLVL